MPKTKTIVNKKVKLPKHVSAKLGNRKSTRSAPQLSTAELQEYVDSQSHRPRDRAKARTVLRSRPVAKPEAPVEVAP